MIELGEVQRNGRGSRVVARSREDLVRSRKRCGRSIQITAQQAYERARVVGLLIAAER